jgi:hypothetical protein
LVFATEKLSSNGANGTFGAGTDVTVRRQCEPILTASHASPTTRGGGL